MKSTHTHTHSCSNHPQSPDSKAQRKSYTCRESWWWLCTWLVVGSRSDGLLGPHTWRAIAVLFNLLVLAALREPHLNRHIRRALMSAKPPLPAPPDRERGKNNTGWFVQVIIFIPEQLEDTSLNVSPRELSECQRSELGAGRGGGGTTLRSSELLTHTTRRIPENPRAARDPPSCPAQAGGGNYSSEKSLSMSMYASSM